MKGKIIMDSKLRPFGIRDKIGYAFGDFGCGLSFSLVSNYMFLFYTQCIGLSAKHWAWIIIVSKAWDAINDILIGTLVDNKKIGKSASKFMPWISIGSLFLVVLTIMIFVPVTSFNQTGKIIWCLLSYCLWSVAYTMVNVPYGSLHSVISDDPKDRTSLSTFRSIGAGFAMIFIMLLPNIVYDDDNRLSANSVFTISIIFSVAAFFILFAMRKLVTERVLREGKSEGEKVNYFSAIKTFFTNRPMVGATIATVSSVIFFMSTASVSNLVFQFYFGDAQKASFATLASYVPLVALMPFIGKIVSKMGKKKFICITSVISTIAGAVMTFLPIPRDSTGIIIWVAGLMLGNLGNCVLQITVWAIVADCIEKSYRETGRREESSLYAIYSFFRKLSQGLGSALIAVLLSAVGFVETAAVQTPQVAANIKMLYAGLIAFGTFIIYISMKFIYNINYKEEMGFDKN